MSEQAKHETWRDWLPVNAKEPPLMTRPELLERLAQSGVNITERELRYWESLGMLPRPVRRFLNGGVNATYPKWHAPVVQLVYQLRGEKIPPPEIRERVLKAFADEERKYSTANNVGVGFRSGGWSDEGWPALPDSLCLALDDFAEEVARIRGKAVIMIDLRVQLSVARGVSYTFVPDQLVGGYPPADQIVSDEPPADKIVS